MCFEGIAAAYGTVGSAATYFGRDLAAEFAGAGGGSLAEAHPHDHSSGWDGYL